MSNKELLALVAAGVSVRTLAQIVTQLSEQYPEPPKSQVQTQNQSQAQAQNQSQAQAQVQTQNQSQAQAQNQSQAQAQARTQLQGPPPSDDFATIMDSLRDLKQAVVQSNVSNSQQPETPSVDDYLATIINPNGGAK